MDPNAKPATICKDGHKRIWHSAQKCPLCAAIYWGEKQQKIAGKWQAKADELQRLVDRLYREQDPVELKCLGEISGRLNIAQ